ncbi:hypothetical protein GCM10009804_65650 [Kribbella hippodromi]|uniref:Uncharacterized protein n=1 Tax=Kribbella hippodromi TaxID=434347 RepID=A0ABP4Q4J4_9ACTN
MSQFKNYIESYHPTLLYRAFGVVLPAAWIVKAANTHTFEDILWAFFLPLRWFLSRPLSLYIAVPAAVVLMAVATVQRRAHMRSELS